MRTRHLLGAPIGLLALILTTLTACGGSAGSGPDLKVPKGFDACAILTQERAQALAGKPVAGISSTLEDAQGRGPLYCPYNAGTMEHLELIGLELRPGASPRVAASRMESAKPYLERLSKKTIQPIQGLGDEAYWVPGLQQLHTRRGSVVIVSTVQAGERPLDDAEALTRDTLAALEKAAAEAKKGKT
ncbi:MAG TPA: hypothetical protein VKM72_11190 [Thermoanaerobaculia bacterium]|nr:hypothetical protein [Thermoanaerobaculia bacterium]